MAIDDFVPKILNNVYKKCGPDWRLRPHSVDNYDIIYIVKGNARFTIDGEIHELGPGDLIYLGGGVETEAVTYPKNLMQCFIVNFNTLYPSSKGRPPSLPRVSNIGLRQDLIDMFREMSISWSNRQEGYIMKTRALLMLILHRLCEILSNKETMTGDYRINNATRFISSHYSDTLTVKALAELVKLDKVYFGHLFKQQTGKTIHQYIMQTRILNAEKMLKSGSYKVREVAENCGFSDVFHFYKSFKAVRGFPPSRCIPRN